MTQAALAFKLDRTLPQSARRVYDYLDTVLDYAEPRPIKGALHAPRCGVSKAFFIRGLDALVARGYLTEYSRLPHGVRVFTLAHSVNLEKRQSA